MAEITASRRLFPELSWRAKRRLGRLARLMVAYPATTVLAILFAVPFLWMVSLSLKTPPDIVRIPPRLIPDPIDWRNYIEAWNSTQRPFQIYFKNSIIYTLLTTLGSLISCSLVAYGFARLDFDGRNFLFVMVLSTMMLPHQVIFIPQYLLFNKLGWIDSLKPLVVPAYFGNAFYIFLLRQFFLTLPLEMDEAALMDGATRFDIYARVVLPLSKPILVTIIAFSFIAHWNDFFGPLVYLHSPERMTVAVALSRFKDEMYTAVDLLMAASVMAVLPIVVVFLMAQRYFVASITMTGLREG